MNTAEQLMCDKFPDRPAVARFIGCGTQGLCSLEYQTLLRQVAQQTDQPLEFAALPQPADPLARDERTLLIAARMSAEQETEEVKARNRDLYNLNTDLKAQVRNLTARNVELEAQVSERDVKLSKLSDEHGEKLAELAELKQEHGVLRASVEA